MSDDGSENLVEKVKVKRVQTEKQKEAFQKCLAGRQESLKVKNKNNEDMKAIKKIDKLEGAVKEIKKTLPKPVVASDSESSEEEIVIVHKKPKKKKKVIVIESESDSEEEEIIQKPKTKKVAVSKPIQIPIPVVAKKTLSFY